MKKMQIPQNDIQSRYDTLLGKYQMLFSAHARLLTSVEEIIQDNRKKQSELDVALKEKYEVIKKLEEEQNNEDTINLTWKKKILSLQETEEKKQLDLKMEYETQIKKIYKDEETKRAQIITEYEDKLAEFQSDLRNEMTDLCKVYNADITEIKNRNESLVIELKKEQQITDILRQEISILTNELDKISKLL